MTRLRRDLFSDGTIAHRDLIGKTEAAEFSDGKALQVITPVADLRLDAASAALDRQILYGHPVCQLENTLGLSRDETTGYVGYVHPYALGPRSEPTHRVSVRASLLFSKPDFKSPGPVHVSLGSLLRVVEEHGKFVETDAGLFALAAHVTPIAQSQPDLAATAALLIGTPYLWGGNSSYGIDCSGLIQLSAQAALQDCSGDSDQQMAELGKTLPEGSTPKRNDLMFWKGHVALVVDPDTLIHANAHHMAVAFEPIRDAVTRIEAQGDGPLLAHKRL